MGLSFENGHDSFEVQCDNREGERQVLGGMAASGPLLGIADIAMGVSFIAMVRALDQAAHSIMSAPFDALVRKGLAEFDRLPFGVCVGNIFRAWLPSGLFSG